MLFNLSSVSLRLTLGFGNLGLIVFLELLESLLIDFNVFLIGINLEKLVVNLSNLILEVLSFPRVCGLSLGFVDLATH